MAISFVEPPNLTPMGALSALTVPMLYMEAPIFMSSISVSRPASAIIPVILLVSMLSEAYFTFKPKERPSPSFRAPDRATHISLGE